MGHNVSNSKFGYAGDVTPEYAWQILQDEKNAVLIDVRTNAEWSSIGLPNLSSISKKVVPVSWRLYPEMNINGDFFNQLSKCVSDKEGKLFFLCRSGARSREAAIEATKEGFTECYNIIGGFEGDQYGHGGDKNGWKAAQLPWGQS